MKEKKYSRQGELPVRAPLNTSTLLCVWHLLPLCGAVKQVLSPAPGGVAQNCWCCVISNERVGFPLP